MLLQCFLEVITSCFCVPYIQQSTPVVGSSATFIDNIFVNSVNLTLFQVTYYFSLLASIVVLILKFLRVFYRPKHKQIFKRNYTFFNNNEFKNEINQIDWKTYLTAMIWIFQIFEYAICPFGDGASSKKLSKNQKSLIYKPWIDNYLWHLMRFRNACFI